MFRNAMAAALIVGNSLTSGAMAGPAVAEGWAEMPFSQDDCIKRAKASIPAAGFPSNQTQGAAVFGFAGDYTAVVRCAAGKKMVIFVVAGPDAGIVNETRKKLNAAFFQ